MKAHVLTPMNNNSRQHAGLRFVRMLACDLPVVRPRVESAPLSLIDGA